MTCQVCGGKTTVVDCVRDVDEVIRRRRCKECNHIFFTSEKDVDYTEGYEKLRSLKWIPNSIKRRKKSKCLN